MRNCMFLTVTTYNLDEINGLNFFKYSLEKNNDFHVDITVLSPTYILKKYSLENKCVLIDIGNERDDKYYCKLVVPEYCTKLNDSQVICYADPDHYCFNNIKIPTIEENTIWVSSECHSILEKIGQEGHFRAIKNIFPQMDDNEIAHYNTSIILCKVKLLKKIYPFWKKVYENLYPIIPHRYLEELSFSIAGNLAGIKIKPVDKTFQGNFFNKEIGCSIFHYGGNYSNSRLIKEHLNKEFFSSFEKIEMKIVAKIRQCK